MSKNIVFALLALVGFFVFSPNSYGQVLEGFEINPGLSYSTQTNNDQNGSNATQTNFYLDANVAYQWGGGFYLGAKYTSNTYTWNSGHGSLTGFGPMIGYDYRDFYVHLGYMFSSSYQTSSTTTYKGGSGYMLDIGYNFFFGTFFFGPAISYKSLSYTTLNNGGADQSLTKNYLYSETVPMFELGVVF